MVAANLPGGSASLRQTLKARTRNLHDRLDAAVGDAPVDPDRYAAFLRIQYAARKPIERWVAAHVPEASAPPPTSDLIAGDLATLGVSPPEEERFAPPQDADWRGMAWAMGGSSLGNKAMLLQRRRAGITGADTFLSNDRTAIYFRALLPELEQPVDPVGATAAVATAEAVFNTFLSATARISPGAAA